MLFIEQNITGRIQYSSEHINTSVVIASRASRHVCRGSTPVPTIVSSSCVPSVIRSASTRQRCSQPPTATTTTTTTSSRRRLLRRLQRRRTLLQQRQMNLLTAAKSASWHRVKGSHWYHADTLAFARVVRTTNRLAIRSTDVLNN